MSSVQTARGSALGGGGLSLCVPLSRSVVPGGTSAQVATVGVGAAELAGVLAGEALVDVGAAPRGLLVVEAGGAEAAEAPQGVVARRPPADLTVQTLVLIWVTGSRQEVNKRGGRSGPKHNQYWESLQ